MKYRLTSVKASASSGYLAVFCVLIICDLYWFAFCKVASHSLTCFKRAFIVLSSCLCRVYVELQRFAITVVELREYFLVGARRGISTTACSHSKIGKLEFLLTLGIVA